MADSRITSLSLVDGLISQDEKYWQRLCVLYGPIIDYWIQKAGVVSADSVDVRQEVLLGIAKNIGGYRHADSESGSLRRWMWGIARNKIADFQRKDIKQVAAAGGTKALDKLHNLPDDPYEDSDPNTENRLRKELVKRALGILKADFEERTWNAFWKTVVEKMPTADVALSLGMTKQAVRQARYRVLQRLRNELGSELRT